MAAPLTICVFAKPPVAGQVKTRLVPALGPEGAARLAAAMLEDQLARVQGLGWGKLVIATILPSATGGGEQGHRGLAGLDGGVPDGGVGGCIAWPADVWDQGDGDLGARQERILRRALELGGPAIAVGADVPGLPAAVFTEARDRLRDHDAVLGLADDGGYYLMGLARMPDRLFAGLPWSQPDTGARMLARLREQGLSVHLLPPWFDVDEPADLARLRERLVTGEIDAPATRRCLCG